MGGVGLLHLHKGVTSVKALNYPSRTGPVVSSLTADASLQVLGGVGGGGGNHCGEFW